MNTPLDPTICTECGKALTHRTPLCSGCENRNRTSKRATDATGEPEQARTALSESRLLQVGGLFILAVGVIAVLADSRFAAGVTFTAGAGIYLTGLLSAWWNRHH